MRLALVVCVFLIGCAGSPDAAVVRAVPGKEFTLPLGGSIVLADTDCVIIFDKVVEDSRCPRGDTCVWAGRLRVKLIAREYAWMDQNTVEVLDANLELDSGLLGYPQHLIGDYVIELRGLEPYPDASTPTGSSPAYVATLIVERPVKPQNTQGSQ